MPGQRLDAGQVAPSARVDSTFSPEPSGEDSW